MEGRGVILEPFWGSGWVLAPKCVLGGVLDRLGGVLEASWKPLGPSWAEKDGQHGPKLAPKNGDKIDKKSIQKSINFLMPLGIVIFGFALIFGAKAEPCWFENAFNN